MRHSRLFPGVLAALLLSSGVATAAADLRVPETPLDVPPSVKPKRKQGRKATYRSMGRSKIYPNKGANEAGRYPPTIGNPFPKAHKSNSSRPEYMRSFSRYASNV